MQRYAIIVWKTLDEVATTQGTVYGWYEELGTALNTATNLMQFGTVAHAVAVKML